MSSAEELQSKRGHMATGILMYATYSFLTFIFLFTRFSFTSVFHFLVLCIVWSFPFTRLLISGSVSFVFVCVSPPPRFISWLNTLYRIHGLSYEPLSFFDSSPKFVARALQKLLHEWFWEARFGMSCVFPSSQLRVRWPLIAFLPLGPCSCAISNFWIWWTASWPNFSTVLSCTCSYL